MIAAVLNDDIRIFFTSCGNERAIGHCSQDANFFAEQLTHNNKSLMIYPFAIFFGD